MIALSESLSSDQPSKATKPRVEASQPAPAAQLWLRVFELNRSRLAPSAADWKTRAESAWSWRTVSHGPARCLADAMTEFQGRSILLANPGRAASQRDALWSLDDRLILFSENKGLQPLLPLPKLMFAVREIGQRSDEETLFLRARYLQLVQALHCTRDHNPATLAALMRIFPLNDLRDRGFGKSLRASSKSKLAA